jgi:hypothetical protein
VVSGAVKDQKKLVAPRLLSNFLARLPRVHVRPSHAEEPRTTGEWVGLVMDGEEVTDVPFCCPAHLKNGYVSGTTRAGKSFTARVLAENAIINGARVLIIDPTRQWCGLTLPATNKDVLHRLDDLGIGRDRATGFQARIYLPGAGVELPDDIGDLLEASSVVSMKDLDDTDRCQIARDILHAVYNQRGEETEQLRLLVVIEEAHSFLSGNVASREAGETAAEIGMLVKRLAREKVKYGCSLLLVSQSLADFRGEGRIVREMCNSRFFMRATDRAEHEFIENYVSRDAVEIVKNLRPGEALVHSQTTPATRVRIRPPLSDVREPTDQELASIGYRRPAPADQHAPALTDQERIALQHIKEHFQRTRQPMLAQEFTKRMHVGCSSRQKLIDGLESKGLIRTVTLEPDGPGRPSQGLVPVMNSAPRPR